VPDDGSGLGRGLPIPITTARLVLRRLEGGDWKDLLECLSDEELFRYAEGRPLSEEEIIHWLESDHHVKLTTPDQAFVLGITASDTGKLIGYLSLRLAGQQRLQAALDVILAGATSGRDSRPRPSPPRSTLLRGNRLAPGQRSLRQPECRGLPAVREGRHETRRRVRPRPPCERRMGQHGLVRRAGRGVS